VAQGEGRLAWSSRSLADEPIVRLILDGTVVRVRLDRKGVRPVTDVLEGRERHIG
jgi:hypothetical protein